MLKRVGNSFPYGNERIVRKVFAECALNDRSCIHVLSDKFYGIGNDIRNRTDKSLTFNKAIIVGIWIPITIAVRIESKCSNEGRKIFLRIMSQSQKPG